MSHEGPSSHPLGQQSQTMVQPHVVVYDMPTPAPLRSWLHSQGLRIPSQVIDDLSSADESEPASAKKLRKRRALSDEKLPDEKQDFGGVDGPPQPQVLHLHEMGISQRLASRGLMSSASSPQLSAYGSRNGSISNYESGHRRGVSGLSSGAGSRYSRRSNLTPPYSTRSRYFPQKSNEGSQRSRSDSNAPYSARAANHRDPKDDDTSKSGQHSSDQSGVSSLIWGFDGLLDDSRNVGKLDLGKNTDGSNSIDQAHCEVHRPLPIPVPSRTSSARYCPQRGSGYKIDQILHTGKGPKSSASFSRVGIGRSVSDAEGKLTSLSPSRLSNYELLDTHSKFWGHKHL